MKRIKEDVQIPMEQTAPSLPTDAKNLSLDMQLCFGLYAASHLMTKAYRPLLRELGLTYPQYLVLLALFEQKTRTVSELGDALMLDSGTLSPLLKRLEAAGLVTKNRHRYDERQVEVTLTEKALALKPKAVEARREIVRSLSMTDDQIALMRKDLDALMHGLDEEATARMLSKDT